MELLKDYRSLLEPKYRIDIANRPKFADRLSGRSFQRKVTVKRPASVYRNIQIERAERHQYFRHVTRKSGNRRPANAQPGVASFPVRQLSPKQRIVELRVERQFGGEYHRLLLDQKLQLLHAKLLAVQARIQPKIFNGGNCAICFTETCVQNACVYAPGRRIPQTGDIDV